MIHTRQILSVAMTLMVSQLFSSAQAQDANLAFNDTSSSIPFDMSGMPGTAGSNQQAQGSSDQQSSTAAQGDLSRTSNQTATQTQQVAMKGVGTNPNLPNTYFGNIAGGIVGRLTGRLPKTTLDSFVSNAGAQAELIYGDEGTDSIPPYFGFDETHRIETGIYSPGLTTGHRSALPEAWGWPN